jgi:hypothetical protein
MWYVYMPDVGICMSRVVSMAHHGFAWSVFWLSGDLRSVEGCDACFAGLVYPMRDALDYVPTDTSFEQFGQDVSDLLQNCQSEFTSAVQGDLGFRAASLLGLRNCELDFAKYQKTTQVVTDYFNSIGRDVSAIAPGNGGAS